MRPPTSSHHSASRLSGFHRKIGMSFPRNRGNPEMYRCGPPSCGGMARYRVFLPWKTGMPAGRSMDYVRQGDLVYDAISAEGSRGVATGGGFGCGARAVRLVRAQRIEFPSAINVFGNENIRVDYYVGKGPGRRPTVFMPAIQGARASFAPHPAETVPEPVSGGPRHK